MLKVGFLAAAAALILSGTGANAADIARPVYKAPPAPVATFSWTGWYVGGHAGYGWGDGDTNIGFVDTPAAGIGPAVASGIIPTAFSPDPDGFFGGVQIGYNHQFSNWLVGFEADFSYSAIDGSTTINTAQPLAFALTSSVTQDLEWFGTIRGRLGWTGGHWLVYATGGAAYGHIKSNYLIDNTIGGGPVFSAGSSSETLWGWTAGGGVEYAWDRWTWRAEYLYLDLADLDYSVPLNTTPAASFLPNVENQFHLVRIGLNYRFDYGKSPVVAKY